MSDVILRQIMENTRDLPDDLQQQVLEYVHSLVRPPQPGGRGQDLLGFAGAIPADDLEVMQRAIELGCEQVDVNEW